MKIPKRKYTTLPFKRRFKQPDLSNSNYDTTFLKNKITSNAYLNFLMISDALDRRVCRILRRR